MTPPTRSQFALVHTPLLSCSCRTARRRSTACAIHQERPQRVFHYRDWQGRHCPVLMPAILSRRTGPILTQNRNLRPKQPPPTALAGVGQGVAFDGLG